MLRQVSRGERINALSRWSSRWGRDAEWRERESERGTGTYGRSIVILIVPFLSPRQLMVDSRRKSPCGAIM